MGLRDFAATSQHPLTYMTAIAAKNDGSVFVADYASKQISRFVYNYLSNELTIPSNSVFLTSSKIQVPVDIELTYNGNYLFVCDAGSNSIKRFDMNGNLVTQFTGSGYTLNRPIFVQPRADVDEVYVIDINTAGGYSLVRFDYNGNVLGNYYNFPQGSIPSDLSERWDRTIIVPDAGLNMVHIFGGYYNYYLGSYNGSNYQNQSMFTSLGRMPTMFHYSDTHISSNTIAIDSWGPQTGFNRFLPGVDVFDLSDYYFQNDFSNETFVFSLSGRARCTFKVIRNRDNYTMLLDENVDRSAGLEQLYHINFAGYEPGTYKIIISAIPYNNADYGSYAVQPVVKEFIVNYGNVLSGNVIFNESYTVDYDETLTIEAGSYLTFNNGASLIVNGTLNVNGTTSSKVVFDFVSQNSTTKNGIKINSTININGTYYYPKGIINNAIIKNAYNGVYVDEAKLVIDNSEIFDCYYGIHLYRTNYISYSSHITNTHAYNNEFGVVMYYSRAYLSFNEFNDNWIGIGCADYSSPYFATYVDNSLPSYGYNNIYNNFIGVFAYGYSNPFISRVTCVSTGGNNIIKNNTQYELQTHTNCNIYAENNWWGSSSPSSSQFMIGSGCSLDFTPYLLSEPQIPQSAIVSPEEETFNKQFNNQLSKASNSTNIFEFTSSEKPKGFDENWPIEWKLLYARNLLRTKKYNSASKICEEVITNYPDSSLSYLALDLLHQSQIKNESKTLFSQFVKEKANKKVKKQIYGAAELLLAGGEKKNRVANLDVILEKYKNSPLIEFVLFQKFMYYLYEENNIELAKSVSEELGKQFPKSESYFDSQRHLGNDVVKPTEPLLAKNAANEETTEIPKTYELLGNYPNPFNPSTTIKYALPYSSNVELTIYDITGKVVKVFSESGQSAGYQNIVWFGDSQQGSRVSSGVYLYRFKATSIDGSNKVFEKTAKMLMLK